MIPNELNPIYGVKLLNPMEIVKMNTQPNAAIYQVIALTTEEGGSWFFTLTRGQAPIYLNSNELSKGAIIYVHTIEGKKQVHSLQLMAEVAIGDVPKVLIWDIVNGFRKDC